MKETVVSEQKLGSKEQATMKAAVVNEFKQDLEIKNVEKPAPGPSFLNFVCSRWQRESGTSQQTRGVAWMTQCLLCIARAADDHVEQGQTDAR